MVINWSVTQVVPYALGKFFFLDKLIAGPFNFVFIIELCIEFFFQPKVFPIKAFYNRN